MIFQKNWQELIKPQKLRVDGGHDAGRSATLVAEPLEIQFERLEFDTGVGGGVGVRDGGEVGLTGERAHARELGADDLDDEPAAGPRVRERL